MAIAHLLWQFSEPHPAPLPDGRMADSTTNGLATLVYVKQNGKWRMDAGENVTVDKVAQPYDPIKHMPGN